ncbi:MAG: hypothetical protein CSA45_02115 [Gammaproteobacteria bacterium]|nr:MAG: hypothetical protein CSA45_02115 [Gammaproteobacteria bacterium]
MGDSNNKNAQCIMKRLILAVFIALLLGGCGNYFSRYNTVYRIQTTNGDHYYSDSQPDLNSSAGVYEIEDLDGNEYQIRKEQIHTIEKYKYHK